MRLVVYTANIGNYEDVLQPIRALGPDVRCYCFTDNPTYRVPGWQMRVVSRMGSAVETARRIKLLAHTFVPDADVSLWMDASFELLVSPMSLVDAWANRADVVWFRHPDRTTIAQEGHEVVRLGRAPRAAVEMQLAGYVATGFNPATQTTLTSTGFCLRWHTPAITAFNERWWALFDAAGHTRDQLSVDVALARSHVRVGYFPGTYRDNSYVRWRSARQRAGWRTRLRARRPGAAAQIAQKLAAMRRGGRR